MNSTNFQRIIGSLGFLALGFYLLFSVNGIARETVTDQINENHDIPCAIVGASKMNILFLGIDNPVKVNVPNIQGDRIKVTIVGGAWSIKKVKRGVYIAKGRQWSREVKIVVAVMTQDSTYKVVANEPFKVKAVPSPSIKIGTCLGDRPVRKVVLKHQKVLHASLGVDWPFSNEKFKVESYSVTVQSAETGNLITEKVVGNGFTQVSHLVDSMPNGGFLNISDVVAVSNSFKRRPMGVGVQVH